MRRLIALAIIAGVATYASAATSRIVVAFDDGAPMDHIVFTNIGSCDTGAIDLGINLNSSVGDLRFGDDAAHLSAPTPHAIRFLEGSETVRTATPVNDGDQTISLSLTGLLPGKSLVLAANIDHRDKSAASTVAAIAGARVLLMRPHGDFEAQATWNADGMATLDMPPCAD